MSQVTITPQKALVAGLAAAVVGLGITLAVTLPGPSCLSDPAATIQAEPAGGIWNGNGSCYTLTDGIKVVKPVTLENATLNDTQTVPLAGETNAKPIVDIVKTSGVTLSNLDLFGAKQQGQGGSAGMAKQSGVTVTMSQSVTIDGVTTQGQFSDGFELIGGQNMTMAGDTVVNSGRHGVTFDGAYGVTVTGLNVEATASGNAFDWESDLAGIGAGNVSVSGSTWHGQNNMIEFFTGPITFNQDNGTGHWTIGSVNSQQPITATGGSYQLPGNSKGLNTAGINQNGGNLTFTNVTFTRKAAKVANAPAYDVTNGGVLTLTHSPIPPPPGVHDASSTVTVTP